MNIFNSPKVNNFERFLSIIFIYVNRISIMYILKNILSTS